MCRSPRNMSGSQSPLLYSKQKIAYAEVEPVSTLPLRSPAMNQSPRANGEGHSMRRTTLSYLTIASHGSSAFIATFLLIHLSAPVLAHLGGASMSSKGMVS